MTWTICSSCNRYTLAYHEKCERCGTTLEGMRALYGVGRQDLPDNFCHACSYVNPQDVGVCGACGNPLPEATHRLQPEPEWLEGPRKALEGVGRVYLEDIVEIYGDRAQRTKPRRTLDSLPHRENLRPSHMKRTENLSFRLLKVWALSLDCVKSWAMGLSPSYVKAWNNLGVARMELRDLVGAEEAFETALRHEAQNAIARQGAAMVKTRIRSLGMRAAEERVNSSGAINASRAGGYTVSVGNGVRRTRPLGALCAAVAGDCSANLVLRAQSTLEQTRRSDVVVGTLL